MKKEVKKVAMQSIHRSILGLADNEYSSGKYICKNLYDTTGKYRIHLNCDFINGSIINGDREPILYRYGLKRPLDHKVVRNPTLVKNQKNE